MIIVIVVVISGEIVGQFRITRSTDNMSGRVICWRAEVTVSANVDFTRTGAKITISSLYFLVVLVFLSIRRPDVVQKPGIDVLSL